MRIHHELLLVAACAAFPATLRSTPDDPTVGDAAPALEVDAPDGVATDWEELRGKVVVLEFWATWCAPCLPALDHLGALAREFGDEVVFLGISPESAERMQRFLDARAVEFPIALDRDGATFAAYGARIVPTTIVVDANGKLAARTRPENVNADVLRRILAGEPSGLEAVHDVASNIDWEPDDSDEGEVFARVVIAPSSSASGGMRFVPGSGRVSGDGMHRDNMIQLAYGVSRTHIRSNLTPWSADDPVFKLSVLAPGGDDDLARRMLARAIEVKFHFEAHFEDVETDVFALAWDPEVHDWPESTAAESERTASAYGGGVDYVGTQLAPVCGWFENIVGKRVVDETGLEGRYDVEMEWVDRASFHEELARLGLELIPERRVVSTLVIDPKP